MAQSSAMQFWFSRSHDVPLRDQIVAQIVLAIVSGEYAAGAKLPSTRELARRYKLHANTVSAAYRELERQRFIERRSGSGVYVLVGRTQLAREPQSQLSQLATELFENALGNGVTMSEVRAQLEPWLNAPRPERILFVDPTPQLQKIVAAELAVVTRLKVATDALSAASNAAATRGSIVACLPSQAAGVRKLLPTGVHLLVLPVRSVPVALAPWLRARKDAVVTIASVWPGFLTFARTLLIAAGFDEESLVFCDAGLKGWQRSLEGSAAVVCDSLLARTIEHPKVIAFPLLAETAAEEVHRFEEFLRN